MNESDQLKMASKTIKLITLVLFAGGIGILLVALYIASEFPAYKDVALLLASILVPIPLSAAFINFILSKWTRQESAFMVQDLVRPTLQALIFPMLSSIADAKVQRYRWFCLLSPSTDPALKRFVTQRVTIHRTLKKMPDELLFVFAVSSDDDCLSEFARHPGRMLLWEIAPVAGINLKPNDPRHMQLEYVRVGAKSVYSQQDNKFTSQSVSGGEASILRLKVPAEYVNDTDVDVSFEFCVAKLAGEAWEEINVRSSIYESCANVDFTLCVSEALGPTSVVGRVTGDPFAALQNKPPQLKNSVFSGQRTSTLAHVMLQYVGPGADVQFAVIRNDGNRKL